MREDGHACHDSGDEHEFRDGSGVQQGQDGLEEYEGPNSVDLVVRVHLGDGRRGDGPEVGTDSGVGNYGVELGDAVTGF